MGLFYVYGNLVTFFEDVQNLQNDGNSLIKSNTGVK